MTKKRLKAALSVLLCVSLMAGWLALPVSAAGDLEIEAHFSESGTIGGAEALGDAIIVPGNPADFVVSISVKNLAKSPMFYTLDLWQMIGIYDPVTEEVLDTEDVFNGTYGQDGVDIKLPVKGSVPSAWAAYDNEVVRDYFNSFLDATKPLPWVFFLVRKGQGGDPDEYVFSDPSTIGSVFFKPSGSAASTLPWMTGNPDEHFKTPAKELLPGEEDVYELHFAWPWERGFTKAERDDWNKNIDSLYGELAASFYYDYSNSLGLYTYDEPKDPDGLGGLYLVNWFEYEVIAEVANAIVTFDAESDAAPGDWKFPLNESLSSVTDGITGKYPEGLPDPGPNKTTGDAFHCWAFEDPDKGLILLDGAADFAFRARPGAAETDAYGPYAFPELHGDYVFPLIAVYKKAMTVQLEVDDEFFPLETPYLYKWDSITNEEPPSPPAPPDAPAKAGHVFKGWFLILEDGTEIAWADVDFSDPEAYGTYGIKTNGEGVYPFVFSAVYEEFSEPSPPPLKVKVKVGTEFYPSDNPYLYEWDPAVDEGSPAPPAQPAPPAKESHAFDNWYLVQADGTKTAWGSVDFSDPEKYGLEADAEGVYTFVFSAYYTADEPEPEPDCEFPWWPLILGGGGLIGGAVIVGGLTIPWLIALPILPLLLMLGGKIISKDDLLPKKDKPVEKPADPDKEPGEDYVPPPKTGESNAWLLVPLCMMSLAGLGMLVLRRRREEEALA